MPPPVAPVPRAGPQWITGLIDVPSRCARAEPTEAELKEEVRETIVEGDMFKNIAYFTTGVRASSTVSVERIGPTEVLVGQPFEIAYRICNLTDLQTGFVAGGSLLFSHRVPAYLSLTQTSIDL